MIANPVTADTLKLLMKPANPPLLSTNKPNLPRNFLLSVISDSNPTIINQVTTHPTVNSAETITNSLVPIAPKPKEVVPIVRKPNEVDSAAGSFKSDHLQLLSTNALPLFTPASPPKLTPFDYHSCPDCGDTFTLKSSLAFHVERRSVLIKFFCDECKTIRSFYNRCALKSYIRAHAEKNEVSDIKKATVFPIPRFLCDGIQNDVASALDEEVASTDDANVTPPTDLLEFSLKEDDGTIVLKDKDSSAVDVSGIKCTECNEIFPSFEARMRHLTNNDKIPVVKTNCNTCQMICPSRCSLKAHQRIHFQVSPYVCPECGESPDAYWLSFQHHVNFQCLHNTRSVGFKCPVCKRVSPSNEALLRHMELHTEKYLKCDTCPRAYMTVLAFQDHVKEIHDGKPVKLNSIFKCSMCDIVFLGSQQMAIHRNTHLKDLTCEYVFNCMQCGKSLESKAALLEHIKMTHPKIHKHIYNNEPIEEKRLAVNNYRGKVECMLCNCSFHSHQGYVVHVNRAHININESCCYCHMIISNRKEMMNHGKKHLKNNYFVCLLCKNKHFKSESTLTAHLDLHLQKLKFCSACPICNELLPGGEQALKHLKIEHYLEKSSPPENSSSAAEKPQQTSENVTCHFCRITFDCDFELQQHLKVKHQVADQNEPVKASTCEAPNSPPSKKQRVDGNVCAKCEFSSSEREVFKKHLLSHKSKGNSFQCQECGLCFIVEPTLTKHLKIIHKITDPKKYIEEEGTNYTPEIEKKTEVPACDSLICSVCFTTFTSETLLKTHMRSHGMAFIRANKSNAVS